MAFKKVRNMKVYEQSGYNYKATPTITLKGQWLKDAGFDIGDSITVTCEDGKLVITPRERSVRCLLRIRRKVVSWHLFPWLSLFWRVDTARANLPRMPITVLA